MAVAKTLLINPKPAGVGVGAPDKEPDIRGERALMVAGNGKMVGWGGWGCEAAMTSKLRLRLGFRSFRV